MPLPFIPLAIPVAHSSGGWIAATSGGGYIASTLSSSWIATFILGNAKWLTIIEFISPASIIGAFGSATGITSGATTAFGSFLTKIGLGGLAKALGIAPVWTFLGLTPTGWAIAGAGVGAAALALYVTKTNLDKINIEREKGGLEPITLKGISEEIQNYEMQSVTGILKHLAKTNRGISFSDNMQEVTINGKKYPIRKLLYIVDENTQIIARKSVGRAIRKPVLAIPLK